MCMHMHRLILGPAPRFALTFRLPTKRPVSAPSSQHGPSHDHYSHRKASPKTLLASNVLLHLDLSIRDYSTGTAAHHKQYQSITTATRPRLLKLNSVVDTSTPGSTLYTTCLSWVSSKTTHYHAPRTIIRQTLQQPPAFVSALPISSFPLASASSWSLLPSLVFWG